MKLRQFYDIRNGGGGTLSLACIVFAYHTAKVELLTFAEYIRESKPTLNKVSEKVAPLLYTPVNH